MAIYNEILAARYARMLQKLFSMKGDAPTKQLSGELMAVLPFFTGVELRILEGWNRFFQWFQVPAQGVGNVGVIRLRNPASSNVIAVIESVLAVNLTATIDTPTIQHGATATDFGAVTGVVSRIDARTVAFPSLILSQGTLGANNLGGNKRMCNLAASTGTFEMITTTQQEITVLPGDAIQVVSALTNTASAPTASLMWRERALESSEISA